MTLEGKPQGAVRQALEQMLTLETDECIIWPFGIDGCKYASLAIGGKQRRLSQYVLERRVGPRPEGMIACHEPVICHDRACINYRHLRWDTYSANAWDREHDGTNRLTREEVAEIRRLYGTMPATQIARQFGIVHSYVRLLALGKKRPLA